MLNILNKLHAKIQNNLFGTIFDFQVIMKKISLFPLMFLVLFSCQSQEIKKAFKNETSDLKSLCRSKKICQALEPG